MKRKDFGGATSRLETVLHDGASTLAATSKRHLRSVQTQIDAIARGDLDTVIAGAHAEVTLDIFAPPEFHWINHTSGIDALRDAVQHNFETLDDQRPEITNVLAEGDAVVLFGRERGKLRASGEPYDVEFVHRFTFRHERLISVRIIVAHTIATR